MADMVMDMVTVTIIMVRRLILIALLSKIFKILVNLTENMYNIIKVRKFSRKEMRTCIYVN
jgi:hypothetical protein